MKNCCMYSLFYESLLKAASIDLLIIILEHGLKAMQRYSLYLLETLMIFHVYKWIVKPFPVLSSSF